MKAFQLIHPSRQQKQQQSIVFSAQRKLNNQQSFSVNASFAAAPTAVSFSSASERFPVASVPDALQRRLEWWFPPALLQQQRQVQKRLFSSGPTDYKEGHSFQRFTRATKFVKEAPVETAEEQAEQGTPLGDGKIVHYPGSPRKVVRSELYGFKLYTTAGPRDHIKPDGSTGMHKHAWVHPMRDAPPQKFVSVNGQTYIVGPSSKSLENVMWNAVTNEKWWQGLTNFTYNARRRQEVFTNYDLIMKTDYCMFWIPSFIVFTITIPTYCMAYMLDELVYTSMTVKIIGRQWYWVYEVESPTDEADEEEEEEEES